MAVRRSNRSYPLGISLAPYNMPLNIHLKLLFKTVSFKPGVVAYACDLSTE